MYLGDSGPTSRNARDEAYVRRAMEALGQALHRIEDDRIVRAFEGDMVMAAARLVARRRRQTFANAFRVYLGIKKILALTGAPKKKRAPEFLQNTQHFARSFFPLRLFPAPTPLLLPQARVAQVLQQHSSSTSQLAGRRCTTAAMGTGKKEANRKERQGKTGDGMANVKVKGENFYRYVVLRTAGLKHLLTPDTALARG